MLFMFHLKFQHYNDKNKTESFYNKSFLIKNYSLFCGKEVNFSKVTLFSFIILKITSGLSQ